MAGRNDSRWRYWKQVVGDQRSSGISIAEFCRQRKLNQASFYGWRKKLESMELEADSLTRDSRLANSAGAAVKDSESAPMSSPLFVPVSVAKSQACSPVSNRADFEVRLPNGIDILVPSQFDASELASLLQTVTRIETDHA